MSLHNRPFSLWRCSALGIGLLALSAAVPLPVTAGPATAMTRIGIIPATNPFALTDAIDISPKLELLQGSTPERTPAGEQATEQPSVWAVNPEVTVGTARVDASSLLLPGAPAWLRDQLAERVLGSLINPLDEITFTRDQLLPRLGATAQWLAIPARVVVRRKGDVLEGEALRERVVAACKSRLIGIPDDQIRIDLNRLPRSLRLPSPAGQVSVTPMSTANLGLVLHQVEVRCQGGERIQQVVQTDVWLEIPAGKLRRLMKRGEIIAESDIEPSLIKVRNRDNLAFVPAADAIGRTLTHYKSPGTLLRRDDLENPPDTPNHAALSQGSQPTSADAVAGPVDPEAGAHAGVPAVAGVDALGTLINQNPAPVAAAAPTTGHTAPAWSAARAQTRDEFAPSMVQTGRPLSADNGATSAMAAVRRGTTAPAGKAGSPLVRQGETVEFTVKSGSLALKVRARALQTGQLGETIRLTNLANNRPITGTVVGKGKVEHETE